MNLSTKIAIIHYMPLEYYPPITNLLDYLGNKVDKINVYSCHNDRNRDNYKERGMKINRFSFPSINDNIIIRIFKYFQFNILTLFSLILLKPNIILYYETYSAFPAYVYCRYFNRKCKLLIHNHEYSSLQWYKNTMKLTKFFHKLEIKWLYNKAIWISQTNDDRNKLFEKDYPFISKNKLKIMPNYPPKEWSNNINQKYQKEISITNPLKLVYVGSLSFEATYIKEVCEWVIKNKGLVTLDVFSYNLHDDIRNYFSYLKSDFINFNVEGIEYSNIKNKLLEFDVGLICYKPYSENVINCVSNKFYEYLACNLDVWFTEIMITTKKYITKSTYPKVVSVDFTNLDNINIYDLYNKEGLYYKPSIYFSETVYSEIYEELVK